MVSVALLIYGNIDSGRNALTEEKYRDLAIAFKEKGYYVESVLYSGERYDQVYKTLLRFEAVLVWVNPIEQGLDRKKLDSMLAELSQKGCFVSAHPEVILKMGTKEVLYKTRNVGWSGDVNMYTSYEDFANRFPGSLENAGIKILKQYRGNGGNGVFKIKKTASDAKLTLIHAKEGIAEQSLSWVDFFGQFKKYFSNKGLLIEQGWNENLANGMVRCYLCGNQVAGFGYQEINALYELERGGSALRIPPSRRFYLTENCGLFDDLRQQMESKWVPLLQKTQSISDDGMPVIWDADFFINKVNSSEPASKYSLCEINVSSVSPFPPSAIPLIVDKTGRGILSKTK